MKIIRKVYLHGSKEDGYELALELRDEGYEISDAAERNLRYMLYEVELELEIDTETGEYAILKVTNGDQVLTLQTELNSFWKKELGA